MAQVDANPFLEETFGSEVLAACLRNALGGTVCPFVLQFAICREPRPWPELSMKENILPDESSCFLI